MALHVPQSLSGLDHAAFDAEMVASWNTPYPWVVSTLPHEAERTPAAYIDWTKHQLAEALAGNPRLRGYDFSRPAFTYAAFELSRWALQTVHLRQLPVRRLATELRRDFARCLHNNNLLTMDERSPLYRQGRVVEKEGYPPCSLIDLNSRHDRNLLEVLAGGLPDAQATTAVSRVEEWLQRSPLAYLTTLDEGHLRIDQREWREQTGRFIDRLCERQLDSDSRVVDLLPQDRTYLLDKSGELALTMLPDPLISEQEQHRIEIERWHRSLRRQCEEFTTAEAYEQYIRLVEDAPPSGLEQPQIGALLADHLVANFDHEAMPLSLVERHQDDPRSDHQFVKDALNDAFEWPLSSTTASAEEALRQRLPLIHHHFILSAATMQTLLMKEESGEILDETDVANLEGARDSLVLCQQWGSRVRAALSNPPFSQMDVLIQVLLSAAGAEMDVRGMRGML